MNEKLIEPSILKKGQTLHSKSVVGGLPICKPYEIWTAARKWFRAGGEDNNPIAGNNMPSLFSLKIYHKFLNITFKLTTDVLLNLLRDFEVSLIHSSCRNFVYLIKKKKFEKLNLNSGLAHSEKLCPDFCEICFSLEKIIW